jgi:hypothetical protein
MSELECPAINEPVRSNAYWLSSSHIGKKFMIDGPIFSPPRSDVMAFLPN